MTALVTGGTGFLGRHVVAALRRTGVATIRVLDDLSSWGGGPVPPMPERPDELMIGDVRSGRDARAAVEGCDLVVHMAVRCVRLSLSSPAEVDQVNAAGTLEVALAARAAGASRFVYVSSSEVYGDAAIDPMGEDHPCRPTTVYGASKLAGEHYARVVMGDRCAVVRPFNAVGEGAHIGGAAGEVVPRWIARALRGRPIPVHGDGAQARDFTYAGDLARGVVLAARCDAIFGTGPLNLCSGRATTMIDLRDRIARVLDMEVATAPTPPRPGDLRRQRGSAARAAALLGREPEVPLDEAIRRCAGWVRARLDDPWEAETPDEPWRMA